MQKVSGLTAEHQKDSQSDWEFFKVSDPQEKTLFANPATAIRTLPPLKKGDRGGFIQDLGAVRAGQL